MKHTKKILSLILVLGIVIGVFMALAISASAADTVVAWKDTDNDGVIDSGEATYTKLNTALAAGGTIKLNGDFYYGDSDEHYILMSSGTTILDLNGHKLTFRSLIETDIIVLGGTADLTITDSKTTGVMNCQSRVDVQLSDSAKLTIAGGNIRTVVAYTQYYLNINQSGDAVFQITGGNHYSIPNAYVAANHKVIVGDSDPRYTVSKIELSEVVAWNDADNDGVIDSGESVFSDMDTALAAGVDLKLNSDVFRDSKYFPPGSLKINSTKTIDLNGHSVVASAYCFEVAGGTLTIKDSAGGGQIWCQNDKYSAISIYSGSSLGLVVEGGTILGDITKYGYHNYPDTVVLKGGNYNFDPSSYVKDSTLTVGQDLSGVWGIRPNAENACSVTIGGEYYYTGEAITPTIVVTELNNGKILTEGIDYTVSFAENVDFGTAEATVTFINDYRGSITETFNIGCDHAYSEHTTGTDKGDGAHSFTCSICNGTGAEDHTMSYIANDDTDTITESCNKGCGYSSTITLKAPSGLVYDGNAKAATVDGTIVGIYEISHTGNINAGTAAATLTVGGQSVSVEFSIAPANITENMITVSSAVYKGTAQMPADYLNVTVGGVELYEGYDYTIGVAAEDEFIHAGTYTVEIIGKGNYTGSVEKTFTIEKAIPGIHIDVAYLEKTYNLQEHTVTLELPAGLDEQYVTVSYWKDGSPLEGAPIDAGDYQVFVSVKGSPNYENYNTDFEMTISPASVTVEIMEINPKFFYTGGAHTPAVIVTLNGGLPFDPTEYGGILHHSNNIEVGTATVTVSGNFTGSCTFEIKKATPTITVSAPLDKVMPGYVMDITGATDAIDNFLYPTTFTVVDGEGYSVSGNTITIDGGVKIGSTITVKMRSTETKNFVAGEGTLELTVGVVAVDISELEADIEDLQRQIAANDGDIEGITKSINNITNSINNLQIAVDALDETDADLQKQITDAIAKAENELLNAVSTLEQKLNDEVAVLQNQITANDGDIDALNAHITRIDGLIDALEAVDETLVSKDADLQKQIADAISKAENELVNAVSTLEQKLNDAQTAIDTVVQNLENAKTALSDAIKNGDEALGDRIDDLNQALADAKAALEQADADNKTELEGKINDAQTILQTAIDDVAKDLADAESELSNAIASGDDALADRINTLTQALADAKAALEKADADNKMKLESDIAQARSALNAAINSVAGDLAYAESKLSSAITEGDKALDDKIAALNKALETAKATLEKSDADNKAELISKIESADATLDEAIKAVQKNLDDAKADLEKTLADGDTALDGKITALSEALEAAKTELATTDADIRTALAEAEAILDEAIKTVQKNLDDAKAELEKALADGDTALDGKITALGETLETAKAALEATDEANKTELIAKINEASNALDKAIKQVQKNLDDVKAELDAKDNELNTMVIVAIVIGGVGVCGNIALLTWIVVDKRKKKV